MSSGSLTKELLKELFLYKNGSLIWKKSIGQRSKIGQVAGSANDRYFSIKIFGKTYKTHRLIWLYFYGYLPKVLDHKDGNTFNNCISNLREATNVQNGYNCKLNKLNKVGAKGVSWHKTKNKYQVRISVDGVRKTIGHYENLDEAVSVANNYRKLNHKEFARYS
jgi:hypothetical protein